MKRLGHAALICAAFALGILASPLPAQTAPDQASQQPTSVPPAPPPDRQASPSVPPPFPPMPAREPRHRFVDIAGHHKSQAHHQMTHVRDRTTHAGHHATHGRHRSTHRHQNAAPSLSKKAIRRCHGMSYRQLLRHKDCAALLQSELSASANAKRHSRNHKAAGRRDKAVCRHAIRHNKSLRHHRS